MKLSVIVPAYNEEMRIGKSLAALLRYLKQSFPDFELIVSDDGSTDGTADIARSIGRQEPRLSVITSPHNAGKGNAVRAGVLKATGGVIVFTDADLSTPAEEIGRFVQIHKETNTPVLIGSRSIQGAQIKIRQPYYREKMGKIFNLFVRILTPLQFHDTQCGFKLFSGEAAKKLFSESKQNGFAFDVEILMLARKFHYDAREIPVTWANDRQTKVGALRDSLKMIIDLIRIRIGV